MAALMFWNTNGRDTGQAVGELCREHEVDLLLLAETETASARLVTQINDVTGTERTFWELPHLESRIRALTHFPPGMVRPVFDDGQVKMLELVVPTHIAGRPILRQPGGEAGLSDHLPVVLTLSIEEEEVGRG